MVHGVRGLQCGALFESLVILIAALTYLAENHIVLRFGHERRKKRGGDWVCIFQPSASPKTFFSRQGTRLPLETSATHRSKE